ncbi:uncharacterized protein [Nicotiana tomentosiformis]|uniref:uncharacterized protein n=1 Tax=Nicotiana tomentosiformis TaxID=4098 RepID=UPI00388CA86A
MGVAETSGVSFTIFQLRGTAYQWWRTFELYIPSEAASLTWTQFSDIFLGEYVPQSLRDAWRVEFEQLHQYAMTVSEYSVQFNDLSKHPPALVATVRERVVRIARRLGGILNQDREKREAKRSRESGTYSGTRAPATACQGRGYMGRPVQSALPAASNDPATTRPQDPYYAPPHFLCYTVL